MTFPLLARRPWLSGVLLLVTAAPIAAQPTAPTPPASGAATQPALAPRPITVADVDRIISVRDPQRSPDGGWVAYAASTVDVAKDKSDTDIWMVKWDGSERIRLTSTAESESTARWSPDGKWVSFLRQDDKKKSQVWTLSRLGGEAQKLTDVAGGVTGHAWSPDSARLVVTSRDVDPTADDDKPDRAPKPIEIETFKFKRDGVGYVDGKLRTHLYLYDIASRATTPLTSGPYDDSAPTWSPDGRHIAFISARSEAREKTTLREVYVIESRSGATPRQVSTRAARHGEPLAWSPDSTRLLYMEGGDPRYDAYEQYRMAVVPLAGGASTLLTPSLDRPVTDAVWSRDGSRVTFVVTDDREQYVASVAAGGGGAITRVTSGQQVVRSLADSPADDHLAVMVSSPRQPDEVHALEGGTLRKLTSHNDWMAKALTLGTVTPVEFTNKEGVRIGALLTLPPGVTRGTRLPFILHIHGGPNGQDSYGFNFDREWIAANGYAVLQVNYRGSHGRGQAFQSAIYGDWGNREVADLLAGVDWAIKEGIADPNRLGIGGWSYGGILTNYTIASDPRFKGAVSGASSSLQLTMYGTDQYIVQYETEMGQPWKHMDRWMKVSYPFFKIDQIKTPTMFMVGEKDFNVPAIGSEQMYQGLKSVGTTTRLVIYPGQFHGITRPSYRRHRLEQWVAWFDTHVRGGTTPAPRPVTATTAEGQR